MVSGKKGGENMTGNVGNATERVKSGKPRTEDEAPENLTSKVFKTENKTFYLDIRENERGMFLKLSEKRYGKRSTVLLADTAVAQLQQLVGRAVSNEFETPEKTNDDSEESKWITIETQQVPASNKRIYLDIMVNKFGKCLNIAEVSSGRGKSSVLIAEQGWSDFQDALNEIASEFPSFASTTVSSSSVPQAPKSGRQQQQQQQPKKQKSTSKTLLSKKLTPKAKLLFLDFLENDDGRFLKMSELRNKRRSTLFVPDVCLEPIQQLLQQFLQKEYHGEVEGLLNEEFSEVDQAEKKGTSTTVCQKVMELEGEPPSENRVFQLVLRENENGQFLKMSELPPGRPSAVFLPEECFDDMIEAIVEYNGLPEEDQE